MNDTIEFEREDLTAYLLGKAGDAETERFDELSVTDKQFSGLLDAVEAELVDAYAAGELTNADRQYFEQRYLRTARGRSRLQFANTFRVHAARNPPAMRAVTIERKESFGLFGFGNFFKWGIATAVVLLILVGAWFLVDNSWSGGAATDSAAANEEPARNELPERDEVVSQTVPSPPQPSPEVSNESPERARTEKEIPTSKEPKRAAPPAVNSKRNPPSTPGGLVLALTLSPQLRGSGQLASLSIPPDAGRVAVRLQLEPSDHRYFRVELHEQATGRLVWHAEKLRSAGSPASVGANIPVDLLRSGIYTFTVYENSGNDIRDAIGDYRFKVVR